VRVQIWHRAESWPGCQALVCSCGLTESKIALPPELLLRLPLTQDRACDAIATICCDQASTPHSARGDPDWKPWNP